MCKKSIVRMSLDSLSIPVQELLLGWKTLGEYR